ncbi:MAG TPA: hypothetical protein VFL82_00360, partial [Thermomicrobiales bacterium]|nr:hypothetical protein [Thermomicrobiales bacterium]
MSTAMPAAAHEYFLQLATEARRLRRPVAVDSGPLIDYLSDLEPTAPLLDILLQDLSITVVISTITLCEAV